MKVTIVIGKFKWLRYFSFAKATLELFQHPENVKISILSLYTVLAEMPYFQKVFNEFSKNFFLAERWWKLATVVENLKGSGILVLL